MLPGLSGSLIAGAFLHDVLLAELRDATNDDARPPFGALLRWWKRVERTLGPASSARAIVDVAVLPLVDLLGYEVLHLEPHANGFVGAVGRDRTTVAVLRTTTWAGDAEQAWRDAVRAGRIAHVRWGLVCTGSTLRVIDAVRTWSRRTIEFDLARVINDERSARAFWALTRRESLIRVEDVSALERIIDRSDAHGTAVRASLSDGVLEALAALVSALDAPYRGRRSLPVNDTFQQSVTIVYRLLFLLFAEARHIVPTWHRVYRDAYSIEALCRRTLERQRTRGLWSAVQAISRLAHAGCRAGDLTVTAFNGRLFSPCHTPLAERAIVADAVIGKAIVSLATTPTMHGRQRRAYADLGVEQLGAVYERVLEHEPSRSNGTCTLSRTSHERKATGSFYTPRAMTEFLVRRTLHPLVSGRTADQILQIRIVDPAMGSGAFLVAACNYLAAAVERALVREGEWGIDDLQRRRIELRRAIAQRCLYGVDSNPMAVQLARLSLWLTTLASDRPLTFLDHHLATGDSLIGASLEDLARQPARARTRSRGVHAALPLFADDTAREMASHVLPDRFRLAVEPADTPEAVRDKERALATLTASGTRLAQWKTAADLWCCGWFWPDAGLTAGVYRDVLASLWSEECMLTNRQQSQVQTTAARLAGEHQFFHWELEFPEVFFDERGRRDPDGGFHAVIGNPPWDALRADSGDANARNRVRAARQSQLRFFRDAGIYRHQGRGHANRYQLFLERALQLTRPNGRIGLILPSGLATDQGSSALRRRVLNTMRVDRLIGFDNREAIFPIHRDVKFLLLTATTGGQTDRVACSFGRTHAPWLDELSDAAADDPPEARPISLERSLLEQWDPDHLTWPLFTSSTDLELLGTISARVLRLGDVKGWNAQFGRELNATEDRPHFVTPSGADQTKLVTIVEGKHLQPFRLIDDGKRLAIPQKVAESLLSADRTFRRSRLAYRDVASATNRVTLIAAVLPPGTISTHTVFCLKTNLSEQSQYCLLALLNSLIANYCVRLQVTTHVTTALMGRLPVPRPRRQSADYRELARLARSLERTGIEGQENDYVRINSITARLYGLTPAQYQYVVGTFPLLDQSFRERCVRDYQSASETPRLRD